MDDHEWETRRKELETRLGELLTHEEAQVVKLLTKGSNPRDISDALGLSLDVVLKRMQGVFDRLLQAALPDPDPSSVTRLRLGPRREQQLAGNRASRSSYGALASLRTRSVEGGSRAG